MSRRPTFRRLLLAGPAVIALLLAAGSPMQANAETPNGQGSWSKPPLYDGRGGATCSHFMADLMPWKRRGGDWRDATGATHGPVPFAQAIPSGPRTSWNVTNLVRKVVASGQTSVMLFLKGMGRSGHVWFQSRESLQVSERPMLVLVYSDGFRQLLSPSADTQIDCSTAYSLGGGDKFVIGDSQSVAIAFNLPKGGQRRELARAEVVLSAAQGPSRALDVGVFELMAPTVSLGPVQDGLAMKYPFDSGIEKHGDVVFAERFESRSFLRKPWMKESHGDMEVVDADASRGLDPLQGGALRVRIRKGEQYGADLRLYLRELGPEPEEIYFRYYLRLGSDWDPAVSGGKLPGLAGTYGKAGWGGRASSSAEGWSLRGSFGQSFEAGHPFAGRTQVGTYAYHKGMRDVFGDGFPWPDGTLERNRWYCIEQHVRVNHVGRADGVLRVWIDGRLSYETTELTLRTNPETKIETVWVNIFHGGTQSAQKDMTLFLDNLVVAKSYIGPFPRKVDTACPKC